MLSWCTVFNMPGCAFPTVPIPVHDCCLQVAEAPRVTPSLKPERRVKMTRLRLRVAERLKGAQNTYAMLTTFNEVDMTALMELRTMYKVTLTHTCTCTCAHAPWISGASCCLAVQPGRQLTQSCGISLAVSDKFLNSTWRHWESLDEHCIQEGAVAVQRCDLSVRPNGYFLVVHDAYLKICV